MPLVTVGIPFHNEEPFLDQAIRSVLAQSLDDFELLLVDDGSTDRSPEIASSFTDPRVRVLPPDGKRRFLAARLNQITRAARSEWVARMDGDDVSHPQRLARQMAKCRAVPDCDAVGTWIALIGDDDRPFAVTEAPAPPRTLKGALTHGVFPHATLLGRRDWLLAHPYDESLTRVEDRDLWCRTVGSRFSVIPSPLYVVRTGTRDAGFLRNYLASQEEWRRLFLRYGRDAMGVIGAAHGWAGSHAKGVVMRLAVRAGFATRLVRARGRSPTEGDVRMVDEALAASRPRNRATR